MKKAIFFTLDALFATILIGIALIISSRYYNGVALSTTKDPCAAVRTDHTYNLNVLISTKKMSGASSSRGKPTTASAHRTVSIPSDLSRENKISRRSTINIACIYLPQKLRII